MYYIAFSAVGDKYQEIAKVFMLYCKGLPQQAWAVQCLHIPRFSGLALELLLGGCCSLNNLPYNLYTFVYLGPLQILYANNVIYDECLFWFTGAISLTSGERVPETE